MMSYPLPRDNLDIKVVVSRRATSLAHSARMLGPPQNFPEPPLTTTITIAENIWPFVLACEMDERLKEGDMMT